MQNVEAEIALDLGDGVKLELVLIRPGSFMMPGNRSETSIRKPISQPTPKLTAREQVQP